MKTFHPLRLSLLLLAMVFAGTSLTAAEKRVSYPRDPSNATNLYYIIKRLKEQQRLQTQRRRPRDYRQGHQKIKQKLAQIRFEEISFDGLTLDEVIQYLSEEIRKKDPEKKGINFMYVGPVATPVQLNGAGADPLAGANGAAGNAPALDALGNPVVAPTPIAIAPAAPELGNVIINLRQPLRNLTALQVLDAVAKTADQPIRFGINNYAIVAMPRSPGSENITSTTLRASPDTFGGGNLVNPVLPTLPVLGNQAGQGGRQGN
ncbi:MAG: hypothetical protein ACPGVU_12290 [Limisphaerales bacterium]